MVLLKSKFSTVLLNIVTSTFHYGSIKIIFSNVEYTKTLKSTFHYGSIKIKFKLLVDLKDTASTFHYGSIKIRAYKTLYIMLFIASYFVDLK